MLNKKCPCDGRNKDCKFCGGWGYLDSIGESRKLDGPMGLSTANKENKIKRKPKIKPITKNKKIPLICSLCQEEVDDFATHKCVSLNKR